MSLASLKDVQSTKYHIIAIQYSSCHLCTQFVLAIKIVQ